MQLLLPIVLFVVLACHHTCTISVIPATFLRLVLCLLGKSVGSFSQTAVYDDTYNSWHCHRSFETKCYLGEAKQK